MPIKRLKLNTTPDKYWKKLVLLCLRCGAHSGHWGCLNSQNMLFRIATLDRITIPAHVVETLRDKGKIKLDTQSGYYSYVSSEHRKTKRRKLG